MTTKTKTPDTFATLLTALQTVYQDEINRLAHVYRPRILAGEFSGYGPPQHGIVDDSPRYRELEEEIAREHPWAQRSDLGRAVLVVSSWAYDKRGTIAGAGLEIALSGPGLKGEVGECMARDVLGLAIERGWLKRGPRNGAEPAPSLRAA